MTFASLREAVLKLTSRLLCSEVGGTPAGFDEGVGYLL